MASEQASNKRPADEKEANGHPAKKTKMTGGVLLFSGLSDYDVRNNIVPDTPSVVWSPHKFAALEGLNIVSVSSGNGSMHFFALTDEGEVYAWGYNATGELGLGDSKNRQTPTLVKGLSGHQIKSIATGRHHSVFLSEEGVALACGDNKSGQLGIGKKLECVSTPTVIPSPNGAEIIQVACGNEFSVILTKNGVMHSMGHPEYGQLGIGTENKELKTAGKVVWGFEYLPQEITDFVLKEDDVRSNTSEKTELPRPKITKIACGANHTACIDSDTKLYTWGWGGYGRLGHSSTNNELVPRLMKCWYRVTGKADAGITNVTCGNAFTIVDTEVKNMKYMFGNQFTNRESNMYPKPLEDLMGWNVRSTACGTRGWIVAADDKVIMSLPSPGNGMLGMGTKKKSSAQPCLVDTLKHLYILEVGMGFAHTLYIARNESCKDKVELAKLPSLTFD